MPHLRINNPFYHTKLKIGKELLQGFNTNNRPPQDPLHKRPHRLIHLPLLHTPNGTLQFLHLQQPLINLHHILQAIQVFFEVLLTLRLAHRQKLSEIIVVFDVVGFEEFVAEEFGAVAEVEVEGGTLYLGRAEDVVEEVEVDVSERELPDAVAFCLVDYLKDF